jgi:integrase
MPSIRKRITTEAVKAMKPGDIVWDTKLSGFGVRCQRRDRVFVYKTRINNRQRWFSIGKFGQPWTVDAAERRVRIIQGDIAKDLDPASIRDERIRNPTLEQAGNEYLKVEISKRKEATQVQYTDFLKRLVYPSLGECKVADLKFSDISRLHHDLRGTPATANRVVAVLSGLFNWCERHGYRPKQSNPAQGIEKNEEKSNERFLSPRELARVGIALSRAERLKTATPYALAAIRLLMFTGCRRDEILELKWKDVKLDKAMLVLADSKTGSRAVYLSAPAMEVLNALPKVAKNPHVIVGDKEGHHLVNLRKVWLRIRKVARLNDVRIHDLRHSFASFGAQGGLSLQMIGKLLGHTKASTTEKYSHLAADPIRAANEATGLQIAAILRGSGADIISLKRKVFPKSGS